ncbi:MAG: methyl-accepting chemotaxis protein [Thermodesulfobacteriota bacterium]
MNRLIDTILTKIQWRVLFTTTIFLFLALILSTYLQTRGVREDHLKYLEVKADVISDHISRGMAREERDKNMELGDHQRQAGDHRSGENQGNGDGAGEVSNLVNLHGLGHVADDLKTMAAKDPEFSEIEVFDRNGAVIVAATHSVSEGELIPHDLLEVALNVSSTVIVPYGENFEIIVPSSFKGEKGHHFIRISSPNGMLKKKVFKRWMDTSWVLGLSLILYLSCTFFYLKKDLVNPIIRLKDYAANVADGDLSRDALVQSKSEIGDIAMAFSNAVRGMRTVVLQSKETLDKVIIATEEITHDSVQVRNGSKSQTEALSDASGSVEELHKNIKDISTNLEEMSYMAEETSSSILEMSSSIREVDENIESLSVNVDETTASIEEIGNSFREVAIKIVGLSQMTDEAVSSISQIDTSIKEIEERASRNAELSKEVSVEGDKGVKSIERTHEGMEKIKEAVQSIYYIIDELGTRAGEIGKVLEVVDEVAEETNLLALNAAILAAQAGEYGKGFGVVAEEVRELAERTASSTKEIDSLIKGVQTQTKKAIFSVKEGIETVEEGEKLSFETIETFKKVLNRFKGSREMSIHIARATGEQAVGTRLVTENMERVTDTIHQLALAAQEQAQGSQMIMKSAENMKGLTAEIKKATGEQARDSKTIASNTEKVTVFAHNINQAVAHQQESSQQIVDAIFKDLALVETNQKNAEELNRIVMKLKENMEILNKGMGKFKVEW